MNGYRDKDGALIEMFDMRVEVFLDEDGYPAVSIQTEKHLSRDFVQVIVDDEIVFAGDYHERMYANESTDRTPLHEDDTEELLDDEDDFEEE